MSTYVEQTYEDRLYELGLYIEDEQERQQAFIELGVQFGNITNNEITAPSIELGTAYESFQLGIQNNNIQSLSETLEISIEDSLAILYGYYVSLYNIDDFPGMRELVLDTLNRTYFLDSVTGICGSGTGGCVLDENIYLPTNRTSIIVLFH
ncbi:MAG: hypothetical protein Q9M91_05850 [Candidatus Dojkabacteria bacterium]|nr:hypothetical protein [Candidatus Dojkabacteria bacterium]MDQ7021323.1 hypothetical protein [Candidatus Dojkabacteria bacterium]